MRTSGEASASPQERRRRPVTAAVAAVLLAAGVMTAVNASPASAATVDTSAIKACFAGRPLRWPGWFLIGAAALFTLLWLSQILPDLLAQRPSRSASELNVPTNPVHVLDLAFFLPAAATTGAGGPRTLFLKIATGQVSGRQVLPTGT